MLIERANHGHRARAGNANGVDAEFNGAMYGHLIVAPINEHFTITNWHETQFAKDDNVKLLLLQLLLDLPKQ